MKFGTKQVEQLDLTNLTSTQFMALAIEASTFLGWVFADVNATGLIAYTNNGLFSWNAEVRIKIQNGFAILQSESRGDNVTDVCENKKNLQNFISKFDRLKKSLIYKESMQKSGKFICNFSSN